MEKKVTRELTGIDRKLIFGFLIIVVIAGAAGLTALLEIIDINKQLQEFPSIIEETKTTATLNSLARKLQYYDEVLTQSARNYAFTKDEKWKNRYFATEPELEEDLERATKLGDLIDQQKFQEITKANIVLEELEHESIKLADEDQLEKAQQILDSEEYLQNKYTYSRKLEDYALRRGQKHEEILLTITRTFEHATEQAETTTTRSTILITLSILLSLTVSIALAISLARSITRPIHQLHHATEEVQKGNYKTRVKIETGDELQQLANAFNRTTQILEKTDTERRSLDAAKTRFLSIISHELRTPMTPMKAQLQMLEKQYLGKLTKQQKESVQTVISNASRLDKIIEDLLEISRIEAARLKFVFKKLDVKNVIMETVNYMKAFSPEKNIKIITSVEKLPTIEADPDRIAQVLRNLLSNALKFSPPNTKIEVTAKPLKENILIYVKDQGTGINPQDQLKLFQPFFQVEETWQREHGGTGLGLAICKGIITSQNGRLWVESQLGKGSTFYFTIPLKPIKDIRPVKLIFSAEEDISKQLEETFLEYLGPLGQYEYETTKAQGLEYPILKSYIQDLAQKGIITNENANNFQEEIAKTLNTQTRTKKTIQKRISEAFE